jgi:SAM-dependent methyltransferase
MTLDDFEALVLSQTPADKPWEPTAAVPYDFESRKIAEGIHPQLIKDVFQPTRVLDVGCGPGCLVRLLIEAGIRDVQGCDRNKQVGHPWFFQADIAEPFVCGWDGELHFGPIGEDREDIDLVICREVLEHLTIRQIRQAVTNLCALSSKFVYVTTRFIRRNGEGGWWRMEQGHSLLDVDTFDDLDPDHRTMLHQDFLRVLFVLEGFKRRNDLEERMDHLKKGRVLVYERAS